jgi:hypothetical protein
MRKSYGGRDLRRAHGSQQAKKCTNKIELITAKLVGTSQRAVRRICMATCAARRARHMHRHQWSARWANAQVANFTVIIGATRQSVMCGRAYSDTSCGQHARISVMGGEQTANTLLTVKLDQLRAQGHTMSAAAAGGVHAADARQVRAQVELLFSSAQLSDDRAGEGVRANCSVRFASGWRSDELELRPGVQALTEGWRRSSKTLRLR